MLEEYNSNDGISSGYGCYVWASTYRQWARYVCYEYYIFLLSVGLYEYRMATELLDCKCFTPPHLQGAEHPHLGAQHRHFLALKEPSDARLKNYGRNPLSFRYPVS